VGAFAAGFALLPLFGVRATNYLAAGINLSLAAFVLWLAARERGRAGGAQAAEEAVTLDELALAEAPPPATIPARAMRAALIAFAISGATAMMLEVLWTRALAVVMGSSIYSFTLILCAFLGGLGGGAKLFGRRRARGGDPVAALGWLHLATAGAILATYLVIDKLPRLFVWLLGQRDRTIVSDVEGIMAMQMVLALVVVLLPTLLMGGVFPLTMRIYAGRADAVGRDVGRAYATNTLGAIVGSFLAGFVVLPRLGLQRGIFAAGALDCTLGVVLCALAPSLVRAGWRRWAAVVAAPAALAALALVVPRWNLVQFDYGLFRVDYVREIVAASGKWSMPELVFYRDGMATTVSVERFGKHYALKNNGKVDASNGDDMPTQIMVGLLPFFFTHPNPTANGAALGPRVLVVGYGSGVTAGATTQTRASRIDVVELEQAVVDASRLFEDVNHKPPADPRVHLHVGDGRNFLAQSRADYDVIISEPSNPWITGVSNLFTREYWALAHKRLAQGGVFCQWAQLYEMSSPHIKTILATFASEFPYTYVFAAEDLSSDVILVASDEPLRLDRQDFARRLADPVFAAEAKRGGIHAAEDVIAYLLLAPEEIPAFTAGSPLNTDDNAIIEFGAPRDLLGYSKYEKYLAHIYSPDWPYAQADHLLAGFSGPDDFARLAESLLEHGKVKRAMHYIQRAGARGGQAKRLATLLANDPQLPEDLDPPRFPDNLPKGELERYAREYAQIERLVARGDWHEARKVLEKWPQAIADKSGPELALLYAHICWHDQDYSDALDLLDTVETDEAYLKRRPQALHLLGRIYYTVANYPKGVSWLRRYLAATDAAPLAAGPSHP
jgi:spermidine synthase